MDPHAVLVLRTERPADHADAVAERWGHVRGIEGCDLFKPNLINHRH
jgi:hypothetical protein